MFMGLYHWYETHKLLLPHTVVIWCYTLCPVILYVCFITILLLYPLSCCYKFIHYSIMHCFSLFVVWQLHLYNVQYFLIITAIEIIAYYLFLYFNKIWEMFRLNKKSNQPVLILCVGTYKKLLLNYYFIELRILSWLR